MSILNRAGKVKALKGHEVVQPYGAPGKVLTAEEDKARQQLFENMSSRLWRLNNLYYIVNEKSKKVPFRMNWAQRTFLRHIWFFNLILKARQLGFTTFICILFLDTCLFRANTHCGIIAHNREDAEEFFANKVKFAYENLPLELREQMYAPSDSAKKLAFSNGSSIRVGTSLRSGTFYMLHISEFGKICARMPAKAQEIVTGSLNTVHAGQYVFIESTAEGRDGYFYQFCMAAKKRLLQAKKLNPLQFRFHFYPWWKNPDYVLDEEQIISTDLVKYFEELESKGIELTRKQKNWYVVKNDLMQDDMMREFPSTPEEAFNASVKGAYYASQMVFLRKNKRITSVPHDSLYPVNVFWDIGINDKMALWFHQQVGIQNRLIRYFEASGEGLQYFIDYMQKLPYIYDTHYMPHDAGNHSPQTGDKFSTYARKLGMAGTIRELDRPRNMDEVLKGIQAVRTFLSTAWIDEELCSEGISHLDNYRKEWDPNLSEFKRSPLHNNASNGADSLRYGAVGCKSQIEHHEEDLVPEHAEDF